MRPAMACRRAAENQSVYGSLVGSQIWAFVGVAVVVIVVPGADMALVAKNTIAGGRPAGLRTIMGTMTGVAVHIAAAILGLSAVLAASATAFETVKLIGAAYLVFLGMQTLWSSRKRAPAATGENGRALASGRPFVQGMLTNVLNPKLSVFFISFVPQFVSTDAPAVPQIAFLSSIFVAMATVWLLVYVSALGRLGRFLSRPLVRRRLDRMVGTVLVGLGLRLALADPG